MVSLSSTMVEEMSCCGSLSNALIECFMPHAACSMLHAPGTEMHMCAERMWGRKAARRSGSRPALS